MKEVTRRGYRTNSRLKLRPQSELYIACEDMDFSWYPWEVQQAIRSYNNGKSLVDIAIELDRDSDECFILLLDLARQGKIKARQGWIWGAEFVN